MSTAQSPNPRSRASGKYATKEQTSLYLERMRGYLQKRCSEWLDRWCDRGGEIHHGVKDLCNDWQADGHLAKWAEEQGWIVRGSVPDGGIKNNQIGRFSALVYCSGLEGRKAIAFELAHYIDACTLEHLTKLAFKYPELVPRIPGRWTIAPGDCVHKWQFPRGGGQRCKVCGGKWIPTGEILEAS